MTTYPAVLYNFMGGAGDHLVALGLGEVLSEHSLEGLLVRGGEARVVHVQDLSTAQFAGQHNCEPRGEGKRAYDEIPRSPSTTAAFLVGCVALQQHANLAGHAPRLTVSLGSYDDVGASSAGCPAVSLIVANRIYPTFRSRSLLFPTGSPAHFFHRHGQEERTPRVRNASQGDGRLTIWRRARSLLVMNLRGLMVTVPLEDILPAKTGLSAPTLRRAPARQGGTAGGDGGPSPLALPRSHNTTQHARCSKPPSAFFSPPKHARCAPRVTAAAWQPRFWLPCGL